MRPDSLLTRWRTYLLTYENDPIGLFLKCILAENDPKRNIATHVGYTYAIS